MGFIPKKKDDETKVFTPLTDPAFRSASLSPMTIEERRKWEVMFARFHQPHSEITTQIQAFALPPGGEAGDALTTDGKNHYYWAHGGCYWLKAGANLYFATGNIAVGDVPNNANTIYAKGNILVQATDAQPYIKISNASDTERDPVFKTAVGATPTVKWTDGLRDSDSDNYLWCNTDGLVDTISGGTGFGTYLIIADYTNNRVKQHLASTLAYSSQVASAGAHRVCTDGTNYYVSDATNHQIRKYLMATNTLLWTVGTQGSGDDQFNAPQGICTDGTYLYIADKTNTRIKKHLCSTGAYVAKVGAYGTALGQFITPTGICTDATYLYITEGEPGVAPILKKHLCSDLSGVSQISADGHLDDTNCQDICTDGVSLYLVNYNNAALNSIFRYTLALVYVSEYGAAGAGNTQFTGPYGICTDKTYLYVADSGNARIKQHLVSDYSYVAQTGTDGVGDSNFNSPRGICVGYLGDTRTGRLLRLRQDGSHFEVWPKLDLYSHLVFREDSVAATDYVALKAPSAITTSYTLTLPAADAAGALTSNGSGTLSFSDSQNVETTDSPVFVTVKLSALTDGYVPYHVNDSTGLANSVIQANTATVGIGGVPVSFRRLTLYSQSIDAGVGIGLMAYMPSRAVSVDEDNGIAGFSFEGFELPIASGTTDSGQRYGGLFQNYVVDANFQGTLTDQYGILLNYGIGSCGASATPTITNSYGLYIIGLDNDGTITNKRGVYQVNANFSNHFDGSVNTATSFKVDDVQVVSNRVVDARIDDAIDSGDATTDGVIDALRDAMIAHGLIAAS